MVLAIIGQTLFASVLQLFSSTASLQPLEPRELPSVLNDIYRWHSDLNAFFIDLDQQSSFSLVTKKFISILHQRSWPLFYSSTLPVNFISILIIFVQYYKIMRIWTATYIVNRIQEWQSPLSPLNEVKTSFVLYFRRTILRILTKSSRLPCGLVNIWSFGSVNEEFG